MAWIGVDFDGTLAEYYGWKGDFSFGRPIPAMIGRIKYWLNEGNEVKIFTARVSGKDEELNKQIANKIQEWLEEQELPRLEVTCIKDKEMIELWDDRVVQVVPNTGKTVIYEILNKSN